MSLRYSTIIVIALLFVVGCKQNPLPTDGQLLLQPPPKPKPVPPPYVIELPESMEFIEGDLKEFEIRVRVPDPGQPIITVDGLPDGAVFDETKMLLSWKPKFDAANTKDDPSVLVRSYTVTFNLRSTEENLVTISRNTVLVVRDTPQQLEMEYEFAKSEASENAAYTEKFVVKSIDFPQGPFELNIPNLPRGATIERDDKDPTVFHFNYTAPVQAVDALEDPFDWSKSKNYKDVELKLVVLAPNGNSKHTSRTLRIWDEREYAKFSGPTTIQQVPDVNFVAALEDVNGEKHPKVSISPRPSFGQVDLDVEYSDGTKNGTTNPVTIMKLKWTGIPADKVGTSYPLSIKACVYRRKYYQDHCKDFKVNVKFDPINHPEPTFDRRSWPLAQVKYIKVNEKEKSYIRIRDNYNTPDVEIFPESAREFVSWSRDYLTVSPKDIGMVQFNVVATTKFGVKSTESFIFDALPWSWHPVLVLGLHLGEAETAETIKLFDNVNVANPTLQPLDEKLLALRSTLVIGTNTLENTALTTAVEEAATKLKNVVIISPLVKNLEGPLSEELKNHQVSLGGRIEDLADIPPVKTLDVELAKPIGGLTQPTSPVKLGGKLTQESKNPMTFILGNDRACQPILNLAHNKLKDPLLLAISCKRKNGGTLLVVGTEWADLSPTGIPHELGLPKQWMSELVKP